MTAGNRFLDLCARVRAALARPVRGSIERSIARGECAAVHTPSPRWKRDRRDVENHPIEDLFFHGPKIGHGYIMRWRKCHLVLVCCGHYEKDVETSACDMYVHVVGLINRKGRRIHGAVPTAIHALRFPMSVIFGDKMDLGALDPDEADAAREILAYIAEVREIASLPCS